MAPGPSFGFRFTPRTHIRPEVLTELREEGAYKAVVRDKAEDAADRARAFAPVDQGDYRDGIEVESIDEGEMSARINATYWTSHFIEWGTVDQAPHAPLRRGVLAAGLKFHESPKP